VWVMIAVKRLTGNDEGHPKSGCVEYMECCVESVCVQERWFDGGEYVDERLFVSLRLLPDNRVVEVREVGHGEHAVELS